MDVSFVLVINNRQKLQNTYEFTTYSVKYLNMCYNKCELKTRVGIA